MVVAHELVHAALAQPHLRPHAAVAVRGHRDVRLRRQPRGRRRRADQRRGVLRDPSKQGAAKRAMSLTRLSKPRALKQDVVGRRSRFAYSYSSAAAYAIAEKHGRKALLRLLTRLQQREDQGLGAQADRPRGARTLQDVARVARERRRRLRLRALEVLAARALACSGDARASRSRDDPRPSGAPRRRADAGGRGDPRRALVPAARARRADARGRRAARSSGSARRGKYLVWELSDDVFLLMHLRMTGTLLLDPSPRAAAHARADRPRRPRARLRRPAPLRHRRAGARPGGARRVLRRPARRRAARARLHRRAPATRSPRPRARRSRRSCSTRSASPASGTSTPTRRCSAPACTRCARRTG